jgi:deoxyribodipyrimidine photo-lyase
LISKACVIVSDDIPVFTMKEHNKIVASKINISYQVVDSNGIIPFFKTDKAPYTAYLFRKILQKNFAEAYANAPLQYPLNQLINKTLIELPLDFRQKWPQIDYRDFIINEFIVNLPIDHSVKIVSEKGTRSEALKIYNHFLKEKLSRYTEDRNQPDAYGSSKMSAYLHFGKISEYEMVKAAITTFDENYIAEKLTYQNGQSGTFYNLNPALESFLDELITWREVGFHFAHHRPDYDQFESLPDWALSTLRDHENDKREYLYNLEKFEQAKTHDPIWNAAQRELIQEGRIHNYLRMLWGKKIVEWTKNPIEALDIMIELNNKYALDGRDPNSYSGIFWVLGRFDRAWAERPVFGKIRFMSSEMTAKKINLKNYLKKFKPY